MRPPQAQAQKCTAPATCLTCSGPTPIAHQILHLSSPPPCWRPPLNDLSTCPRLPSSCAAHRDVPAHCLEAHQCRGRPPKPTPRPAAAAVQPWRLAARCRGGGRSAAHGAVLGPPTRAAMGALPSKEEARRQAAKRLFKEHFRQLMSLEPLVAAERAQGIAPECGRLQALYSTLGSYLVDLGMEELNIKRRMRECQPQLSPRDQGCLRWLSARYDPVAACHHVAGAQQAGAPAHEIPDMPEPTPPLPPGQRRSTSACAADIVVAAATQHLAACEQPFRSWPPAACLFTAGSEQAALPHVTPRAPVCLLLTQTSWLNCTLR